VGKKRIILKDGIERPLMGRKPVNTFSVKKDTAALRLFKAGNKPYNRTAGNWEFTALRNTRKSSR
jgi:hypothetical protein